MADNRERIDAMYSGDRMWAFGLLALLWLSVLFVFFMVTPYASSEAWWALVISGGLVLLFNTASIFAMTQHYSEDRENIYGLDIHYLDQMKN